MNKRWTMAEKKLLSTLLHLTDEEISKQIPGTTRIIVQAARKRFNLIKPIESGRFKKNGAPWNKGIAYNAGGRSINTRFKKGQPPPTAFRKFGDVFSIPDGTGKVYMFIKLPENRQYPYGRYVWEQATDEPLTKNDMIRFRDGNPLNCSFGNLEKVSRSQNAIRNANHKKAGEELKKTWAVVKTYEDYGLTPPYKFRSKRKSTTGKPASI